MCRFTKTAISSLQQSRPTPRHSNTNDPSLQGDKEVVLAAMHSRVTWGPRGQFPVGSVLGTSLW